MAAHILSSLYQCKAPSGANSGIEGQNNVYPSQVSNGWITNYGNTNIQGTTWTNDTSLTCNGDPTTSSGGFIRLNTGANHDCNCFWGNVNAGELSERHVRGIHFRNWTNGVKFRPRITGVALVFVDSSSKKKYMGLQYQDNGYYQDAAGYIKHEGTSSSNYWWATAKRGTADGNYFHDPNYVWAGVLFHYETTWKSGSAVNCDVYISHLRPIVDCNENSTPSYNNKYRVWGTRFK